MTDDRQMTVYRVGDEAAPQLESRRPAGKPAAQPPRRRGGVAAGRIAAAGIGIAAMVGLVANMEVASSKAPAEKTTPGGPAPSLDALRWEKSAFLGSATLRGRIADAAKATPIVLTPHTIVKTVGGGSSGGSSGGYSGGYASSSYSAPAAAPVATTSGSGH